MIAGGLSHPPIGRGGTLLLCLPGRTRKWPRGFSTLSHFSLSLSEGEILMQMSDTQRLLTSDLEVVVSVFPEGLVRVGDRRDFPPRSSLAFAPFAPSPSLSRACWQVLPPCTWWRRVAELPWLEPGFMPFPVLFVGCRHKQGMPASRAGGLGGAGLFLGGLVARGSPVL